MIVFMRYVLLLASLLSSVLALPLAARDVVDPPITSPTANTIWRVGQTQTVTWNTTGLPTNQTNPAGRLVLGYWYNNSENLMLSSPLATNLSYATGQAQITVPDVPTRTDYIVVLFGDSGNASPEFTIINDASSSASGPPATTGSSGSSSADPPPPASTAHSTNPDHPNNPTSSPTQPVGSPSAGSGGGATATGTAASGQTTTNRSTTLTVTASATAVSSGQSSAAWQKHIPGLGASLSISLTLIYFVFS